VSIGLSIGLLRNKRAGGCPVHRWAPFAYGGFSVPEMVCNEDGLSWRDPARTEVRFVSRKGNVEFFFVAVRKPPNRRGGADFPVSQRVTTGAPVLHSTRSLPPYRESGVLNYGVEQRNPTRSGRPEHRDELPRRAAISTITHLHRPSLKRRVENGTTHRPNRRET
jgi:hypothetical protein